MNNWIDKTMYLFAKEVWLSAIMGAGYIIYGDYCFYDWCWSLKFLGQEFRKEDGNEVGKIGQTGTPEDGLDSMSVSLSKPPS